MRKMILAVAVATLCGNLMAQSTTQPSERTTATGLKIIELGQDPRTAKAGDTVAVHYTGTLQSNGQKFDSSLDRHDPIKFELGSGHVIKGWDEGIAGMKIGDKRKLIIPPDLAYGKAGAGNGLIPPDATLVFDVELVGIERD